MSDRSGHGSPIQRPFQPAGNTISPHRDTPVTGAKLGEESPRLSANSD
jgi:hypothetical protein